MGGEGRETGDLRSERVVGDEERERRERASQEKEGLCCSSEGYGRAPTTLGQAKPFARHHTPPVSGQSRLYNLNCLYWHA